MKILYSNVIEIHAGWGAEVFVNDALKDLGHQTYCIDYRKHRNDLATQFLRAPECDVFLLQRGDFFPKALLQSLQIPKFFWASELVSRCRDQDRLLSSGLFDHVFLRTPGCVSAVVDNRWLSKEQCSVLLSGFDPKVHRWLSVTERDIDVLFVGTVTPRRQRLLDKIAGQFSLVTASAFGDTLVELFNRAKIVLNIHASDALDTETRVFETLGCRTFLLSETLSEENPFSSDEVVQFHNEDEMLDKIGYYLQHESEREDIAVRGYVSAIGGHTYAHRAQQLINVFNDTEYRCKAQHMINRGRGWRIYRASEPLIRPFYFALRARDGIVRRKNKFSKLVRTATDWGRSS